MTAPTAVITGASSGIGAATARRLAAAGYRVVLTARRAERIEALAAELTAAGQQAVAYPLDVTDRAAVETFAASLDAYPSIDVLVNNAGGALGADPVATADPEDWRTMYETNVLGTLHLTQTLLPALTAAGRSAVRGTATSGTAAEGTSAAEPAANGAAADGAATAGSAGGSGAGSGAGTVVIVSSTAGHATYEGGGGYVAAKHGAHVIAETLRLELCGEPVRVIEIAPGMVKTEEFATTRYKGDREKAAAVYAGVAEPLTAEDVADTIEWAVTRPGHVNIDLLVVRPRAQASNYKVHRSS